MSTYKQSVLELLRPRSYEPLLVVAGDFRLGRHHCVSSRLEVTVTESRACLCNLHNLELNSPALALPVFALEYEADPRPGKCKRTSAAKNHALKASAC